MRTAEPGGGRGGRSWAAPLARLGLRARLLLLGGAGLAIGLAVGGVLLVLVLQSALERAVDRAGAQTAGDVAALLDAGRLPDPIPAGGTTIVQVIGADGTVRAASTGADRLVSSVAPDLLSDAVDGRLGYQPGYRFGVTEPVRVVIRAAGPTADPQTVVVAVPAGDVAESVRVVRLGLLIGYAVLLLAAVVLAWRLIGATLRPVTALRQGAEEITGAGAETRLPVPAARDEIHDLAVTLNDMLARLAAAGARQRAFVADAAHELRSPLASLHTQLEVGAATGRLESDDLLAEVQRLTRLVDDLLVLARSDAAAPVRRNPVDLAALAAEVAARYADARVPVTAELPTSADAPPAAIADTTAIVLGDRDALDRVLANLLDNAVRYAATAVRLTVAVVEDEVRVEVTDDGPGIPAADRERVFDRFTRLAAARDRDTGGSGLGLAIVRELVHRHGGRVHVDAVDPHGTRLTVVLPAHAGT